MGGRHGCTLASSDQLTYPGQGYLGYLFRLTGDRTLYERHCFCFFINGLDEYQETVQKDNKEMVTLLTSWASCASRGVKLCVSGREHNVFMSGISPEQRFRPHQLTWFDMVAYATNKLADYLDQWDRQTLVNAVVTKAEGIFQWAAVVVKEMCCQLEKGAGRDTLMQLVHSLPGELDILYWRILKSLGRSDRRKAYQTFSIIPLSTTWGLPVTLLAYSFLNNYGTDTRFAERKDFRQTDTDGLVKDERTELDRKRLNGCCKGLIEPVDRKIGISPREICIAYTHRSIPEFLGTKDVRDEIELLLTGFQAAGALSQLTLAEFRFLGKSHYKTCYDLTKLVLRLRYDCRLDAPPFTFLGSWDAHIERLPLYRGPKELSETTRSDVELREDSFFVPLSCIKTALHAFTLKQRDRALKPARLFTLSAP